MGQVALKDVTFDGFRIREGRNKMIILDILCEDFFIDSLLFPLPSLYLSAHS
jgi:hypothetical protein